MANSRLCFLLETRGPYNSVLWLIITITVHAWQQLYTVRPQISSHFAPRTGHLESIIFIADREHPGDAVPFDPTACAPPGPCLESAACVELYDSSLSRAPNTPTSPTDRSIVTDPKSSMYYVLCTMDSTVQRMSRAGCQHVSSVPL